GKLRPAPRSPATRSNRICPSGPLPSLVWYGAGVRPYNPAPAPEGLRPEDTARRHPVRGRQGMLHDLRQRAAHYLLLAAVTPALCLPNLGAPSLWDIDEGNNATAAREMLAADNWVIPTFNGELRVDKPALLYWLQILAYQQFGVNEFSARLPSALAA